MASKKTKTGKPVSPAKPTNTRVTLSGWFEKHFRVLGISVLCLAGLLRVSLLLELPQMPFHQLHEASDLDMNFFDQWGDRISGGDILTDTVWHPYHSWHKAIAESFGLTEEHAAKVKWNEWYGGKQYHQEPLYALLVGFAKMIGGEGRMLVYLLQMLLSLISIWMVIWLGKHYFSAMAGILSGLLFTFYGPALLFDVILLRTSLSTIFLLGSIVLAEQLILGRRKEWLMGLVGGAGYLLQTTSILLWLPLVARWLYLKPGDIRQVWKTGLVFSIFLSFLIYRNSVTDSPLLSSSSVGPVTYVLSNFPDYKPEIGFAYFAEAGELLEETGGKMLPSALRVIGLHDSIWDWVGLQFKKLGAIFHWYEIPNNINTYLAREFSFTLKLTFIPYSLIAALGLMGLIFNLTNKKTVNLLAGILSQVIVMVIFYVLCRFRVPMVAVLCVYAGFTLQKFADFRDTRNWIIFLTGSMLLWFAILRPWPEIPAPFTRGDLSTIFKVYYLPKLDELSAKDDLNSCTRLLEEFIATRPEYVRDPKQLASLDSPNQRDVAYYYGLVYGDLGNLYAETGNTIESNAKKEMSAVLLKAGEQR